MPKVVKFKLSSYAATLILSIAKSINEISNIAIKQIVNIEKILCFKFNAKQKRKYILFIVVDIKE